MRRSPRLCYLFLFEIEIDNDRYIISSHNQSYTYIYMILHIYIWLYIYTYIIIYTYIQQCIDLKWFSSAVAPSTSTSLWPLSGNRIIRRWVSLALPPAPRFSVWNLARGQRLYKRCEENGIMWEKHGKTIISHPFGNGLYYNSTYFW